MNEANFFDQMEDKSQRPVVKNCIKCGWQLENTNGEICSRCIDIAEGRLTMTSDISYGQHGATFHHLGGVYQSYEERDSERRQAVQNHNCSKCGSENTQSFEMAYHGGTNQNNFSGSGYSFHAGNVNVSGTSYNQSSLAAITSPPKSPNPFLLAIILTFVIPIISFVPLVLAYFISPFKFALYIIIDIGLIVGAYVFCGIFLSPPAWAKYKERTAQWNRSWICLRCGNMFYLN